MMNPEHDSLIPPPALDSIADKPTWVNRADRIDRSACIELRALEVWPLIDDKAWRSRVASHTSRTNRLVASHDRPSAKRRPSHILAAADFIIDARFLAHLHDTRRPRQLAGDFRTAKSNAMKTHLRNPFSSIAPNPNRGPDRTKRLGVWSGCDAGDADSLRFSTGWTQALRVERWYLHERLSQHFLICPRCRKKQLKLFMPLGSAKELDDARFAEGWLKLVDAHHQAGRIPIDHGLYACRARMIDRYGALFRDTGRNLMCRKCLNIRYGEVKWSRLHRREAELNVQRQAARAQEDAQTRAERDAAHEQIMQRLAQALGIARDSKACDAASDE